MPRPFRALAILVPAALLLAGCAAGAAPNGGPAPQTVSIPADIPLEDLLLSEVEASAISPAYIVVSPPADDSGRMAATSENNLLESFGAECGAALWAAQYEPMVTLSAGGSPVWSTQFFDGDGGVSSVSIVRAEDAAAAQAIVAATDSAIASCAGVGRGVASTVDGGSAAIFTFEGQGEPQEQIMFSVDNVLVVVGGSAEFADVLAPAQNDKLTAIADGAEPNTPDDDELPVAASHQEWCVNLARYAGIDADETDITAVPATNEHGYSVMCTWMHYIIGATESADEATAEALLASYGKVEDTIPAGEQSELGLDGVTASYQYSADASGTAGNLDVQKGVRVATVSIIRLGEQVDEATIKAELAALAHYALALPMAQPGD